MLGSLCAGCTPERAFDNELRSITEPYRFSIFKWELDTFQQAIENTFTDGNTDIGADDSAVSEYYSLKDRIGMLERQIEAADFNRESVDTASLDTQLDELTQRRAALADTVERTIETRIKEVLARQGIYNPVDKYIDFEVVLPPVNFTLEKPPHLLVVSPRDRIESFREITLLPDMSVEDMESIEEAVTELGYSALVTRIGGIATYPAFVTDTGDLRFTINAATEEWLHQYLAFKPLGFMYVLDLAGIRRNYEIATMNETMAGIVSREIGNRIYEEYYQPGEEEDPVTPTISGFDFNREMREIRSAVDDYLERGEIEAAEEFMEEKRLYLFEHGYYIRKLNQAYFAFYGTYADRPTSVNPIGADMRQLRERSTSLKEFLEVAAAMTSRQDLSEAMK